MFVDVFVDVTIDVNIVKWQSLEGYLLRFDRREYESEIVTKSNDPSWEDNNRTAERLVNVVFADTVLSNGYKYNWSSARIEKGKITLSFGLESQQKLIEFSWEPENPLTAEKKAKELKLGIIEK